MKRGIRAFLRALFNPHAWSYGLFWSWNLIFLAFMALGFAPRMLPELLTAVRSQTVPAVFLTYAVILVLIPLVAVILGLTRLRRQPGRLFLLGYGVQGPLMLILVIRFFVVREANLAVTVLLAVAGVGILTLLWCILDRQIDRRGGLFPWLRLLGLTLLLIVNLYASSWIAFYAVPVGLEGGRALLDLVRNLPTLLLELWRHPPDLREVAFGWLPLMILGPLLMLYTATLFVLMPIAVPLLSLRAWWRGMGALAVRARVPSWGWLTSASLTLVTLAICGMLFVLTNRQPQQQAFALLDEPPGSMSAAQALLMQQETIRAGLLNAYLAPQRYISAVGEITHIQDIYQDILSGRERVDRVQQLYELVARPVLYEPVQTVAVAPGDTRRVGRPVREEQMQAAELYEAFFDQPIQQGERASVVQAMRSTWSVAEAQAGWLAVDDREVYLAQQEVTIRQQGDWAEGELYEVYQNRTAQRQEVIYYFSLPESSVITGVWLGNSPDRAQRFVYRVAPRGAAQTLYRNEIRRNMDPALVEQIGPRQYRLRIFPVEPMATSWDTASGLRRVEEGPPLHLWLTWRVLASANGWPLPGLAEKRNVYWDAGSLRLVNGVATGAGADEWLPATAPATAPSPPQTHRIDFPNGESVVARPATSADLPAAAGNWQLAVVLDRSRSMGEQAGAVTAALARLGEVATNGAQIDLYLTASAYRGEEPSMVALADLEPAQLSYLGGQTGAALLAQFHALRQARHYDGVLVLTDDGAFKLGATTTATATLSAAPIWMVHLGGSFPLGYDDATLDAIQASGGGVVGDLEEALTRFQVALAAQDDPSTAMTSDILDGYLWLAAPTANLSGDAPATAVAAADDGFAAFAARRLILVATQRARAKLDQVAALDQLHALAVEQSIVTPLSSMIVLVTDRQAELLKELESRGDRFVREGEEVGETVPERAFGLNGVPEPEEWLLLAVVAGMLLWYGLAQQRQRWRETQNVIRDA